MFSFNQNKNLSFELFDAANMRFTSNRNEMMKIIKKSKKNAVLFCFAEYDYSVGDDIFPVRRFYEKVEPETMMLFAFIADDFLVFRSVVSNSQQINLTAAHIKQLLILPQQIQSLLIKAHGRQDRMRLGEQGAFAYLSGNDEENNFAMTKTLMHLAHDATIILNGCNTARDVLNIAKQLSLLKSAQGKFILGSPSFTSDIHYKILRKTSDDKLHFFSFFVERKANQAGVKIYQSGDKLVSGRWQHRSRL